MVSAQCFTALKLMMMVSIYHFCAILVVVARACPYPCFLAEVVLRGEILINPSSDGLGVVITAGIVLLGVF